MMDKPCEKTAFPDENRPDYSDPNRPGVIPISDGRWMRPDEIEEEILLNTLERRRQRRMEQQNRK